MERKISPSYLELDMYVAKLDRPWSETTFSIHGFLITRKEEILSLVKQCDYLYIDTEKGAPSNAYLDKIRKPANFRTLETNKDLEGSLISGKKTVTYVNKETTENELPQAKAAFNTATKLVADIMKMGAHDDKLNVKAVKGAVEPIVSSMIKNSDAFVWMVKMQNLDTYTYDHSVENCALGIAFGRHMGMRKTELQALAMGLLLMDIGKAKLPKALLTKQSVLNKEETLQMQKHVAYSVEILKKTEGLHENVINIALTHHERYDGSGYPNNLLGNQTPIYGRIAAIIDCYSTMTTSTPYHKAIPEHTALQKIYNLRDQYFQHELVEQFLQCMGVYPTGSLVELSTGEIGMVLSQNSTQRLKPKIMMLMDENKQKYTERRITDLAEQNEDSNGMSIHIIRGLDREENNTELRESIATAI